MAGFHRLHYVEWGPADHPHVIVCAHGYSGNARDFDYLAQALAGNARVICIDVAGRGDSDWLDSALGYHFGQFIADIHSLLAHLKVKEVDWVGTSMGGLLGMLLASQPSTPVRRLVMNDVGAFLPLDALQAIARNLDGPASFASLAEVEAHFRRTRREWGALTDEQWRHFAVHGSRKDTNGRFRLHYDPQIARVAQPLPFSPGLFFWDAWYRLRCPVLLLRGERSEILPAAVAKTMLDIRPGTRLVELPGVGHVPALMSDEEAALVGNFLDVGASEQDDARQPAPVARAA